MLMVVLSLFFVLSRPAKAKRTALWTIDETFSLATIEIDGSCGEVWYVVRAELILIVLQRVALRQQEGFSADTFSVNVAEVEAGMETIIASAAEYEPPAVAAPVVVAFRVFTVYCFSQWGGCRRGAQGTTFASLQIEEP